MSGRKKIFEIIEIISLVAGCITLFKACYDPDPPKVSRPSGPQKTAKEWKEEYRRILSYPNTPEGLYGQIAYNDSIPAAKKHLADSLKSAYRDVAASTEKIKAELDQGNMDDATLEAVNTLMIDHKAAARLYKKLQDYYRVTIACCGDDKASAREVSEIFARINEQEDAGKFEKNYFRDIPKMAAITMLNKFSIDCEKAQLIALNAVLRAR